MGGGGVAYYFIYLELNLICSSYSAALVTPVLPVPRSGSHNAITYCLDMNDRSPVDPMQPDMLQKLDKYMKPLIRPFVYKWSITQVLALPDGTRLRQLWLH